MGEGGGGEGSEVVNSYQSRLEGGEGATNLSCAGEEGGADTAGLPSLETLSCSPVFTSLGTLGVRLVRGVTELTILRDNNNLLLPSTELQDSESSVIPTVALAANLTLTWRLGRIITPACYLNTINQQ